MNVAAVEAATDIICGSCSWQHEPRRALRAKETAFAKIVKIGRTHTPDATPLTLGQEFSGYAAQVESGIARPRLAVKDLYPLAQGGTGLNSKPKFACTFARHVTKITRLPFTSAVNKFEAPASNDSCVFTHGARQFGGDRAVQDRQSCAVRCSAITPPSRSGAARDISN